jgi:hypothetical protein
MMQAWADYLDLLKENGRKGKMIRKEDQLERYQIGSPVSVSRTQ